MRLKAPFKITRFPLFQNANRNLFRCKYEQDLFKHFLLNYGKRRAQEI